MDKKNPVKTTIIAVLSAIIVLLGGYSVKNLGSVTVGNEYQYVNFSGSSIATSTEITTGTYAIGSMIITDKASTTCTIWDATSTAAVINTTYADKIATFPTSTPEGTYTLDVQTNRGIVFQCSSSTFNGEYTLTARK